MSLRSFFSDCRKCCRLGAWAPLLLAALVTGIAQWALPTEASAQINVTAATWGLNATPVFSPNGCDPVNFPTFYTPVSPGNITRFAALACNGQYNCTYVAWGGPSNVPGIDLNGNGIYNEFPADDPAFGCNKGPLTVSYTCGNDATVRSASISNLSATMNCPQPVNCQVSAFSSFGACSASCGGGTQTATRTILIPPANGGAPCPSLTETQSCNTQPCPVDCVVSAWSGFGSCSFANNLCGDGTQTRTRTITTQPANGGAACPALSDTQACNVACTPAQLIELACPPANAWRNHGQYVECVEKAAEQLADTHVITEQQKHVFVEAAAHSSIGKHPGDKDDDDRDHDKKDKDGHGGKGHGR